MNIKTNDVTHFSNTFMLLFLALYQVFLWTAPWSAPTDQLNTSKPIAILYHISFVSSLTNFILQPFLN